MIGIVIALIKSMMVKSIEALTTSGGIADAGKVLKVGDDGNIEAVELTVGQGTVAVDSTLSISGAAAESRAVSSAITLTNAEVTALTGLLS